MAAEPPLRDRVAFWLAEAALMLATPRARARVRVALVYAAGGVPSLKLQAQAAWSRKAGA